MWGSGPQKSLSPGWGKRTEVGGWGVGHILQATGKFPLPVLSSSYSPCNVKPELASLLVNLNFASQPVQAALPICTDDPCPLPAAWPPSEGRGTGMRPGVEGRGRPADEQSRAGSHTRVLLPALPCPTSRISNVTVSKDLSALISGSVTSQTPSYGNVPSKIVTGEQGGSRLQKSLDYDYEYEYDY